MSLTDAQVDSVALLKSATEGFDHLFSNQIKDAREVFAAHQSPFHLIGQGVCSFLEAALGMENDMMAEASRCLALSEVGAKSQIKTSKSKGNPGLEWEILQADAVVLLGLTQALSETYIGYLQCIYSLNSAHSKFTKLYKTVFPAGLGEYSTPSTSPAPSRKSSNPSIKSVATSVPSKSGFFSRWTTSTSTLTVPRTAAAPTAPDGPIEDMIVAGTAFGFGLFNLVFSLMPGRVKSVVGFFGFDHDRKLALQALAVSAAKKDVHSVFAGLVLMTYHGAILLLSGYQADEEHIIKQYKAIVDSIEIRYPAGALWMLNRAKILRMCHDAEGAIRILQAGLEPQCSHSFVQADTLLVFELAWTLLAQRRYQEAAGMFIKLISLNNWSHATYRFIAAGCYLSLRDYKKTQELLDTIPGLLEKRKISGKDLPTEVLIKKKLAFYKAKQARRKGLESEYAQCIKISPAEEWAIFWNMHARIEKSNAILHIQEWSALSPAVNVPSQYILNPTPGSASIPTAPDSAPSLLDLDTPDELAVRSLLLGIVHRTAGDFPASRLFLVDAHQRHHEVQTSTWVAGVAMFELAVLDLKEAEATEKAGGDGGVANGSEKEKAMGGKLLSMWTKALNDATQKLNSALALATSSTDLSSRLDSRIAMLKEEVATKKEMLGIV